MPEQQQDYITPLISEFNTKLRDLEEKQRLLKDRVLLIGENLVDSKEEIEKAIIELKIQSEQSRQNIERMRETLQRIAEEMETKARTSDIEMLRKQFKMFEPLKLARMEDVEKMIKEAKR